MELPTLTNTGDLPAGVYRVSLAQTIAHFGVGSPQRRLLASRLQRIYHTAFQTKQLTRFVVFGSFVTGKSNPNDVDVFMIMSDNFDVAEVAGEARLLFDHNAAQSHFGCSVFWIRKLAAIGGEEAAVEDWQVKRDGTMRGILEIIGA